MTRAKLVGVLLAMFSYPSAVAAVPLINNSGLVSPSQVITFCAPPAPPAIPPCALPAIPQGFPVTNQYINFGVTFEGFFYNTEPVLFPTESLANYDLTFEPGNPDGSASILFTRVVSAAAFALQGGPASVSISALLGNQVVKDNSGVDQKYSHQVLQNTPSSPSSQNNNFYGFTNILFDEIRILPPDGFKLFQLDNLQFSISRVPEPGTLALLGLGFALLFFLGKGRTDTNSFFPSTGKD